MRKVLMFSCERAHRTPEVRLREDFSAFMVAGIGKGDELWIHPTGGDPIRLAEGKSLIPPHIRGKSIIVEKRAGEQPALTSVEVFT
jgi:hypothetical protein